MPPDVILKRAFGRCVRELRMRKGIAQEQLAVIADIERAHMGRLERGEKMPSLRTIYLVLDALDISIFEFALEMEKALREEMREHKNNAPPSH